MAEETEDGENNPYNGFSVFYADDGTHGQRLEPDPEFGPDWPDSAKTPGWYWSEATAADGDGYWTAPSGPFPTKIAAFKDLLSYLRGEGLNDGDWVY